MGNGTGIRYTSAVRMVRDMGIRRILRMDISMSIIRNVRVIALWIPMMV